MIEIRWHGRGGQGAKTAALIFAETALESGKYIQAFPEYGPERMGAPVCAFNRLSDKPINIHCGVKSPNIVVVLDPTLVDTADVTSGMPDDGILLVNTESMPPDFRKEKKIEKGKIFTVDASKIAIETIGRDIPNTPMLSALARVSGLIDQERLISYTEKKLGKKKQDLIKGNIEAIKRAYNEVKGEL
ncbi:TPA: pyruvate synthase [bacterium]|nr:pyruvate synthase [bacterium]